MPLQRVALALLVLGFTRINVEGIRIAGSDASNQNPIRKVVNLLQNMLKKVEAEGEKEKDLYEKFNCYCTTGQSDLELSISNNNAKVPALQSDIETAVSQVARLKEDLKQHQADRASAKSAIQEATALRTGDNEKFTKEAGELKSYITALKKAIPAISAGMSGTKFLQADSAQAAALRRATASDEQLTDIDRQSVITFLSGTSASGSNYVPVSAEIVGILQQMQGDFEKDLSTITATEEEAKKLFDQLVVAKNKEVKINSASIEKKTARVGDLEVEITHMKHDLTESESMLIEDQAFLRDLGKNCASKAKEWEERQVTRSEEIQAIHETIKILNDDDALDLFKKTLPSASFVQIKTKAERARQDAHALILKLWNDGNDKSDRPEVRFLEMALQNKKVDFTKVIKMIDDMVALLEQEQVDDDAKREYCRTQIDTTEDKLKESTKTIQDLKMSIEERTEAIATLGDELKTLQTEIVELDKLVQESTEQRKQENEDYSELMSQNAAAKEILEYAKNRLHKFYNPKLYRPPPKVEASAVLLQSAARHRRHRADPGDAPETFGAYSKKGEDSNGVLSMIDLLIRDLTKEMTEAKTDEKNSQQDYEEFMQDSAAKRAKAVKAIGVKESARADNEMMKTQAEGDMKESVQEMMAMKKYEDQLHAECDWLVSTYDLRKTARAEEMDNLKKAKAILNGADFSLL